jgi:hypothetical protein
MPRRLLWVLAISTAGCDTTVEGPPSADFDGDGFYEGQDCDDVDAAVFPGAEEVWYDGVDQDCAGDDDYDADADGVRAVEGGGADCDDTDPLISPLGVEVWYDGIDQDCDGGSDDDADGDGFDSDAVGGDDCDDDDAAVWPGATGEVWYDGIDQDCAGDDDYDADADGARAISYGGADCDDADDAIFPGAEEVWYDGIDQDCAGDDDDDADQDGYISEDYGGDDCFDDDALAYPGAAEKIDGLDGDCDGNDDDFSVDDVYGVAVIRGAEPYAGLGTFFDVADIDGDGAVDMAIVQEADIYQTPSGGGLIQVFDNGSLQRSTSASDADAQLWSDATLGTLSQLAFISDLDGDSSPELAVRAEGTATVYIATGAEMSGESYLADVDRQIDSGSGNASFGAVIATLEELDGDGVPELVISAPDSDTVYIWDTGGLSSNGIYSVDDADGVLGSNSDDAYGSAVIELDDLDGDGYSEIAVGAPDARSEQGEVYIYSGRATLPQPNTPLTIALTIRGDDAADRNGTTLATGDFDGDGDVDLAIGAAGEETRAGRIHVINNSQLSSSGIIGVGAADFVSYGGATINGFAGTALAGGADIDGDGVDDLVVGGPGASGGLTEAGEAWAVISGETGDRALVNAAASFYGPQTGSAVGSAVGLADINGDGLADILMSAPGIGSILDGEGAVYIGFSGF